MKLILETDNEELISKVAKFADNEFQNSDSVGKLSSDQPPHKLVEWLTED